MSRLGVSRTRHIKYRDRFRKSVTHLNWVDNRAEPAVDGGIGDTADAQDFTADNTTNTLTDVGHGFDTGDGPFFLQTTGTLPTGLSTTQHYWVIRIDDDTFQLSGGQLAALEGSVVSFTDDGA